MLEEYEQQPWLLDCRVCTEATARRTRVLAIGDQGEAGAENRLYLGSKRAHRPADPYKKVEGEALHLFGGVWRPIGPV